MAFNKKDVTLFQDSHYLLALEVEPKSTDSNLSCLEVDGPLLRVPATSMCHSTELVSDTVRFQLHTHFWVCGEAEHQSL